jgi:hypothetical protein
MPGGRVTLCAMFAFAPLAAGFVAEALSGAAWVPSRSAARRAVQALAVLLVACHVLLPMSGHAVRLARFVMGSRPALSRTAEVFHAPGRELVIVNSPYIMYLSYLPFLLAQDNVELPSHMRVLSSSFGDIRVRRSGDRTLTIISAGSPLIPARLRRSDCPTNAPARSHLYEGWLVSTVYHSDRARLAAGDRIELTGMTAEVLAVDDRGLPTEVSFTFDHSLDDPRYRWVCWNSARGIYENFLPPRPREEMLLPGPFALAR